MRWRTTELPRLEWLRIEDGCYPPRSLRRLDFCVTLGRDSRFGMSQSPIARECLNVAVVLSKRVSQELHCTTQVSAPPPNRAGRLPFCLVVLRKRSPCACQWTLVVRENTAIWATPKVVATSTTWFSCLTSSIPHIPLYQSTGHGFASVFEFLVCYCLERSGARRSCKPMAPATIKILLARHLFNMRPR